MFTPHKILPFLALAVGGAGMLISFIYMWSDQLPEIICAGMAFVAAAVLTGAGVLSYSICERLPRLS
ncbi:MAG: hypothetical protein ACYTF0_05485 [Planctomycetota bacterium]|jgi:hypothetical protein